MSRALVLILLALGLGLAFLFYNHDAGQTFGIENNDFAQALALGVWGAVLAAALVASRSSAGVFLKSAAIWILLLLALVAVYVYRSDLQSFASRLTSGLIPGQASRVAGEPNSLSFARGIDRQFALQAHINGEPVRMVVDTGASTVVLTEADARAAGFHTGSLQFNVPVATANGRALAAPVRLEALSVGSIERRDVRALVARAEQLDRSLLGMSFLETLEAVELRGDQLILRD